MLVKDGESVATQPNVHGFPRTHTSLGWNVELSLDGFEKLHVVVAAVAVMVVGWYSVMGVMLVGSRSGILELHGTVRRCFAASKVAIVSMLLVMIQAEGFNVVVCHPGCCFSAARCDPIVWETVHRWRRTSFSKTFLCSLLNREHQSTDGMSWSKMLIEDTTKQIASSRKNTGMSISESHRYS